MSTLKEKFDAQKGYCPKLGHHLTFKYCRSMQDGLPCPKVSDCWFEKFDITAYLKENYTAEEIDRFLAPPKSKLVSLAELIQKAQQQNKKG
jgi:hypothetical protein